MKSRSNTATTEPSRNLTLLSQKSPWISCRGSLRLFPSPVQSRVFASSSESLATRSSAEDCAQPVCEANPRSPISRRPGLGEGEPCGTKCGPDGLDPFEASRGHPGSIDADHVSSIWPRELQVQVR